MNGSRICGSDPLSRLKNKVSNSLPYELWKEGIYQLPEPEDRKSWLKGFRANPEQYALKTPSGKIELFSEVVHSFDLEDCKGHASWLEPAERLGGNLHDKYPLALLTPQPKHRLHSQLDHSQYAQNAKRDGLD